MQVWDLLLGQMVRCNGGIRHYWDAGNIELAPFAAALELGFGLGTEFSTGFGQLFNRLVR